MEVIIYSKDYCPYCKMAKNLLEKSNIKFKEVQISSQEEMEDLVKKTNHMTVPQIFIDGKFIGGYDNLSELKKEGKLKV